MSDYQIIEELTNKSLSADERKEMNKVIIALWDRDFSKVSEGLWGTNSSLSFIPYSPLIKIFKSKNLKVARESAIKKCETELANYLQQFH